MTLGKFIVALSLVLIGFQSMAKADVLTNDVYRAAQENQARLLKTIRELKKEKSQGFNYFSTLSTNSRDRHCDDDDRPEPSTCVPKCNVRGSSGSCLSYGSDYCGENATCVEKCNVRGSSGSCLSYGADYCGNNVSCHEVCNVRGSSGTCLSYGEDQCY